MLYLKWAKKHYRMGGKVTDTFTGLKSAFRTLRQLYGRSPAVDFGPKRFKVVRLRLLEPREVDNEQAKVRQLSRSTINAHCATISRLFRWAAAEELVPVSVPQALSMVQGLQRGRTTAKESKPVLPVDDAIVEQTILHVSSVVADMVRLQRLTGMRPAEVCQVRPSDVDTTGDVWTYRPETHKTEHHGHSRVIAIGPQGQDILRAYLLRDATDYCFSPVDSEKKQRQRQSENRKTRIEYGNSPGTNRKRKPKVTAGPLYTTDSYRHAIKRGCAKAKIPAWSPNQLRHSAATRIRAQFGLEAAQVTLGHSNANITQVYAERDLSKAIEVARQVG